MKYYFRFLTILCFVLASNSMKLDAQVQSQTTPQQAKSKHKIHATKDADIAVAVKAAAIKDCGCGECAAKGCKPCHGKNCFYCAAKGLVTEECGCGMCSSTGCDACGPGCDVCKFHLAPVKEAKKH
jgi:hypothetical protein